MKKRFLDLRVYLFIFFLLCGVAAHAQSQCFSNLPVVPLTPKTWKTDFIVVLVSGDGGWANLDRRMSDYLLVRGTSVVGLNARKYFWHKKSPGEAANALECIMNYYAKAWNKEKFVLIGYSRGASVVPFMVNRIRSELRDKIILIALLGPEQDEDFEIHLLDYININTSKNALPVLPEVEKLKDKKILCFCGDKEKDSLCNLVDTSKIKVIRFKGGHHFGGDYESITSLILSEVR